MDEPPRGAETDDARRYWSTGRVALGALVVGMLGFWIWIMGMAFGVFDSPDNPDRLASSDFADQAEPRCAETHEAIDMLPSPREAKTPADRAVQVQIGTDLTAALVADLRSASVMVVDAGDAELVERWLDDWDAYVDDRRRHVARLEAADDRTSDRDLAFTLTERVGGGIYTRRIDQFAILNGMASCQIPGDI